MTAFSGSAFLQHHRTNNRLKIEPSDKKTCRPFISVNGLSPQKEGKLNSLMASADAEEGEGSRASITFHFPHYPKVTKVASEESYIYVLPS